MTNFEHEFVKLTDEEKEDYKKNINPRGVFPYLKDESSGESLGESLAIARFMCNSKPESGLYGSTVYETARIDELLEKHQFMFGSTIFKVMGSTLGFHPVTKEEFQESSKKTKDYLRTLDGLIKDKEYFFGDKLSLADVYIAVSLNLLFATVLDAGFRKAIPNLTSWYEKVRANGDIESVLGKPRFCGKPLKPKLAE